MLHQSIAEALSRLRARANSKHPYIFRSDEISRADRELLLRTSWLSEIMKGWYLLIRPDILPNDSAAWFAHFWDFIAIYLEQRFGKVYCLSAESSLDVLLDISVLPKQVIAIVPQGGGKAKTLPFETSLLMYSDLKNIPEDRIEKRGLQIMPLALAISKVFPSYFRTKPEEAEIALRSIRNVSELSRIILQNNYKSAADRLVGAYYFLGDNTKAENLKKDMIAVGMQITPENPFQQSKPFLKTLRPISPYVARMEALWQSNREAIVNIFSPSLRVMIDIEEYMHELDEIYQFDAYNSLSIEGYQVTPDLIEKVKNNAWDPKQFPADNEQRNALAARGYYEAFQQVRETVRKVITFKANSGELLEEDLQEWYRKLFSPSVQAGIIQPEQLLGYRKHPVYIRNSRHVPPQADAIIDCMEYLFKILKEESEASVRAIIGHYLFVFIHPYMDGNGRIARFLMNAMFASDMYPWIVIPLARRNEYMQTLNVADLEHNLIPFAKFVVDLFNNYTFRNIIIVNAIKTIISDAGYNTKDFEISVWSLSPEGKNITVCYKKNRKCKKDFTPSYNANETSVFLKEVSLLFSDKKRLRETFLID